MINLKKLKDEGKLCVYQLGTFHVKPRRKGKIHGAFGSTPKYEKRITFTPSEYLKKFINGIL